MCFILEDICEVKEIFPKFHVLRTLSKNEITSYKNSMGSKKKVAEFTYCKIWLLTTTQNLPHKFLVYIYLVKRYLYRLVYIYNF